MEYPKQSIAHYILSAVARKHVKKQKSWIGATVGLCIGKFAIVAQARDAMNAVQLQVMNL